MAFRPYNLDPHRAQVLRKIFDAVAAGGQVRAPGIASHHANARELIRGLCVVEDFSKRGHV
jgi:hypothetical protein